MAYHEMMQIMWPEVPDIYGLQLSKHCWGPDCVIAPM